MKVKILFHPEAEKEIDDAVIWYRKQLIGLELEFIKCIDEVIRKIKKEPELYPFIFENYRKAVVKRFPFIIIYEKVKSTIRILAVFHSRRNPKGIKNRNLDP